MAGKKIKYSEPAGYFPKELRDKILAAGKTKGETPAPKPESAKKKKK